MESHDKIRFRRLVYKWSCMQVLRRGTREGNLWLIKRRKDMPCGQPKCKDGRQKSMSGQEQGVITKGVFSLKEYLESLKSLDSLESLEHGRILLYFPESGGSLKSLESLESGLF